MCKKTILTLLLSFGVISIWAQKPSFPNQKLSVAERAIKECYVDTLNENKLVESAIRGMIEKLDPHSSYIPAEEVKAMNEPLEGDFDGIGIQFNIQKDTLFVAQTIVGGPSERVGLLAGDRIIAVDDTPIAGVKMSDRDIMKRLRGPKGSAVMLTVLRKGVPQPMLFKIIRDKIPIYTIDAAYMVDKTTGYINLSRFGENSYKEFVEALKKLQAAGMKDLILDLQGNGGGYMEIASSIANEILGKDQLIVYMEGNAQSRKESVAQGGGLFENGRIILLVDDQSASASEILAGAVQDWDRGVIVGRRTFGKGLVQAPINLPDGSMLRLTIARYYTPSGRSIQRPYDKGKESYRHDWIDRLKSGELMHADSIHFSDSLKYQTLGRGRTVYGGGGVMPDVFVPLDTTRLSDYHRRLLANGSIIKYTMDYVGDHRDKLKKTYKNVDRYIQKFEVTPEMLNELTTLAAQEGVTRNEEQFNFSKRLISQQIKALIAQHIFDTSAYYQVINQENDIYKKALEIIHGAEYNRYLLPSNP